MKKYFPLLALLLMATTATAGEPRFEYFKRVTPSIKRERLVCAKTLNEVMPEFGKYLSMAFYDHKYATPLSTTYSSQGYYIRPTENYNDIIQFVGAEITASCNGKMMTAKNTGAELTVDEKNILFNADAGSDIVIKVQFRSTSTYLSDENKKTVVTGDYAVTVMPETEAEFPGGFNQLTDYLTKNVLDKLPSKKYYENIFGMVVKFVVNENGQTTNPKVERSSGDTKIDQLIIDAISKMPSWMPAKNFLGIKIKQEMKLPFGAGC